MFLNYIALLTALSISGVAAYYSIYGLTAIFSGVFWPIVIMGSVLEVGKIVTTVWLHTYWGHLKWLLKSYMSLAVIVLMFITSMGIFGFLSRAHIEVTSQAGGGDLLVQQVDQNIAIEQRRIDDARKVMAQMDDAVGSLLKGSGANADRDNNRTAAMATQATKLRDSQKKERDSLNASIDASNNRITELSRQKLKLNQEQLKMEAEVGPIKYIAQLIYDDNANKDMMERAVRWVIIVIVAVFDPLAVAMVLGVTMVMNRRKEDQAEQQAQAEAEVHQDPEVIQKIVEVPVEVIREVQVPVEVIREVLIKDDSEIQRLEEELAEAIVKLEAQPPVVDNTDYATISKLTTALDHMLAENESKQHTINHLQSQLQAVQDIAKEQAAGADAEDFTANAHSSILGPEFPDTGEIGQLFINTGKPDLLYKFNGTNWIQVDKATNTSYTDDEHWQHWQIGRLGRGEIELDELTVTEQVAIEEKLANG
jgi:hypothetical protein